MIFFFLTELDNICCIPFANILTRIFTSECNNLSWTVLVCGNKSKDNYYLMNLNRSHPASNLLVLWGCWVLPCYMVIFCQIIFCHRYSIVSNNWSGSRFHLRVFKDFYLRSCEAKVAAQKQMVWRKRLGFHLMPSKTYGWLSIPGITHAVCDTGDGYLLHTVREIKLLRSSNVAIWDERRGIAGLTERFDKSMGSVEYKERKHFAENEISKMKKVEITRESSRFILLEDYRSQDMWTSPSISSHPLKQCLFPQGQFQATLVCRC